MCAKPIGIDLGTTYSVMAVVNDHGHPEIIPNADGERITPSAVFFDTDVIVVGQTAKEHAVTDCDQVVLFAKRQMGNPHWFFQYGGKRLSAIDVSALILAKLKQDAKAAGIDMHQVIITVPAYFDDERRRTTMAAGRAAGLEVIDVINEPTAAAAAFGAMRAATPETILVYDLGGGTFDVTVLHIDGQAITVKATGGNHQLGGKDFDDLIMGWMVAKFQEEHGVDPTVEKSVAAELRNQAERAKRELSRRPRAVLQLRAKSGKTTNAELTREEFDRLIQPKIDTTLSVVRITLQEAHLTAGQIDRVLLVGGSTRVPSVKAALREFFNREPDSTINPDEAVALGAALVAANRALTAGDDTITPAMAEKVGGLQITDVTSHSFGIEAIRRDTNQKINTILIPRNSPLPAEAAREFVTSLPGQTAIQVIIYQGEFADPALCNPIGEFTLAGLPPGRAPGCKVRLVVKCDTSGIVHVSALDIESGREATTQVSYRVKTNTRQSPISMQGKILVPIE